MAEICLGFVLLGLTAYGVFGSADFGAGFWDLTAGGAQRGDRVRGLKRERPDGLTSARKSAWWWSLKCAHGKLVESGWTSKPPSCAPTVATSSLLHSRHVVWVRVAAAEQKASETALRVGAPSSSATGISREQLGERVALTPVVHRVEPEQRFHDLARGSKKPGGRTHTSLYAWVFERLTNGTPAAEVPSPISDANEPAAVRRGEGHHRPVLTQLARRALLGSHLRPCDAGGSVAGAHTNTEVRFLEVLAPMVEEIERR